jgi:hypothetical protein
MKQHPEHEYHARNSCSRRIFQKELILGLVRPYVMQKVLIPQLKKLSLDTLPILNMMPGNEVQEDEVPVKLKK